MEPNQMPGDTMQNPFLWSNVSMCLASCSWSSTTPTFQNAPLPLWRVNSSSPRDSTTFPRAVGRRFFLCWVSLFLFSYSNESVTHPWVRKPFLCVIIRSRMIMPEFLRFFSNSLIDLRICPFFYGLWSCSSEGLLCEFPCRYWVFPRCFLYWPLHCGSGILVPRAHRSS